MTSTPTTPTLFDRNKNLRDRIRNNFVNLTNYNKHNGQNCAKTGTAMITNEQHLIANLRVFDIDINKTLDDKEKQQIRENVIHKLSDDDIIVKTGSGGLHVYANIDEYPIKHNSYIKCFTSVDFDIDLFSSVELKQSLVVLPESKVINNNVITTYEFVQGSSVVCRNIQDIANDLGIELKLTKSTTSNNQLIVNEKRNVHEYDKDVVNNETITFEEHSSANYGFEQLLVNGLVNLDIHNDTACHQIKDEITLMPSFCAINSLSTNELRDVAYNNVKTKCGLTQNAKRYFDYAKDRYKKDKSSIFVLAKVLKYHSKDYYKKNIEDLVNRVIYGVMHEIDLKSKFSLNDVRNKAKSGQYSFSSEVAEDLSKLMRMLDNTTDSWLM